MRATEETPERAEALSALEALDVEYRCTAAEASRLSEERKEAIHAAYAAGATIPELANRLGVSREAISKVLGRPRSSAIRARERDQENQASPAPER